MSKMTFFQVLSSIFLFTTKYHGMLPLTSGKKECDRTFHVDPMSSFSSQSQCYYLFDEQKLYNYTEAKTLCFRGNAHILFIETLEEHTTLKTVEPTYSQVWLGLQKNANGEWNWIDVGEKVIPVSETRWKSSQTDTVLNVAHTENIHSSTNWIQSDPSWEYQLICEASINIMPGSSEGIKTPARTSTTSECRSRSGLYKVTKELLYGVQLASIKNTDRAVQCARHCLQKSSDFFTFDKEEFLCDIYSLAASGPEVATVDCEKQKVCYTIV